MLLLEMNVDQRPPGGAPQTGGQSCLLTFPLADDVPHFGGKGGVLEKRVVQIEKLFARRHRLMLQQQQQQPLLGFRL